MKAGATILLVEDDDAVRAIARRVLVEEGYGVIEAADAGAAVTAADRHAGGIDLLLTDHAIGDVSGTELIARLDLTARGMRAVVMSGSPPQRADDGAPVVWLQKPFGADTLLAAVREALEGLSDPRSAPA